MHEASSRPGAPRPDTGKGHRCIHVFETWEAQLRWMQSARSMLLTPLIFPHSPGPLALKIAGRIAEFFPDAVLIMRLGFQNGELKERRKGNPWKPSTALPLSTQLDNQKLVPQPHVPPVIVLENHGLRWVPKDKNL